MQQKLFKYAAKIIQILEKFVQLISSGNYSGIHKIYPIISVEALKT